MAQTHDIDFFFYFSWMKWNAPFLHRAETREIDAPFRFDPKSRVVRFGLLPFGMVFGKWQDSGLNEEAALYAAIQGHAYDESDQPWGNEEIRAAIRAQVAESATDLDEEWEILSMMGMAE